MLCFSKATSVTQITLIRDFTLGCQMGDQSKIFRSPQTKSSRIGKCFFASLQQRFMVVENSSRVAHVKWHGNSGFIQLWGVPDQDHIPSHLESWYWFFFLVFSAVCSKFKLVTSQVWNCGLHLISLPNSMTFQRLIPHFPCFQRRRRQITMSMFSTYLIINIHLLFFV